MHKMQFTNILHAVVITNLSPAKTDDKTLQLPLMEFI